jgi:hypothetical protein
MTKEPTSFWRKLALAVACTAFSALVVPRWWCGRDAADYFDGDRDVQIDLGRGVAGAITGHTGLHFYRTGDARFDGQSAIAIYQMAIMGLSQIVSEHPEAREEFLPALRSAADRLVDSKTLEYAAQRYGQHGVVRMDPGEGHAYLGYIGLALGMLRVADPNTPHARLHDRINEDLAERLSRAPHGLIETYPGETWPPDVAAVAGSIGLHARVTGADRGAMLKSWSQRFERCAVDRSGYLVQRVKSGSCAPADLPRGSGTAIASYFIGFADSALSARLERALSKQGAQSYLGFGGVREYLPGRRGRGDMNAGPIVLGLSVGASGYALAAARAHGDRELFESVYRSAHLFGVPIRRDGVRSFAVGGVLGNALLLAMLTAQPAAGAR